MPDPAPQRPPITIVLADDHTVIRSGLRLLLDAVEDFQVVAEAGTIRGVFQQVRAEWPMVLVLDLNMPGGSSIEAIPRLVKMAPKMSVVVLTMDDSPAFVRAAFDAGAKGYVLKEAAGTELVDAIRVAASPG